MRTTRIPALAAGLLLAAPPAAAQTEIVLYGRLNTSFERTRIEGRPGIDQLVNNNSRFGVRGIEPLGNGLSATWQFEAGFRSDTGEGFTPRDTWVGLNTGLGTVRAGFFASPLYYAVHEPVSMHNHDTGTSLDRLIWVPAMDPELFRVRNSVTYATPILGGFRAEAHYALLREGPDPGAATPVRREHHVAFAGSYDRGPLHVGFGHARTRNFYSQGGRDAMLALGAKYDFGMAVLAGLVERDVSDGGRFFSDTGIGGRHTRDYWRLAVKVPLKAHELHANYGRASDWSGTGDTGARQWTLAWGYNFSPRTRLYAFYTKIDNDAPGGTGGGRTTFPRGTGDVGVTANEDTGLDRSSAAVGLRHNF